MLFWVWTGYLPNHVLLNYFDKIVVFDYFGRSKDRMFISANQVVTYLKEDAQVYMILSNLGVETKVSMGGLQVVKEFPKVFPVIYSVYHLRERER